VRWSISPSRRHLQVLIFCLLRLIRQPRGQPALYLSDRHAFACGVVFDLVAREVAGVIVGGLGMGEGVAFR
jgi:hypothetical protein